MIDSRKPGGSGTLRFVATGFVVTVFVLALLLWERDGIADLRSRPVFYRLFMVEDFPAVFLMLAAMLLVAPLPAAQRAATALAEVLGRRPLAVSLIVFFVLCLGSVFIYHRHPLSMDEYVPWAQSRIFLAGRLTGQYPPELLDWLILKGNQNYFFAVSRETGQFASSYWPGLALLFTPFMALGIPWACNPAIGAASVWVIHRLTLDLSKSSEAAGAALLFTLASPVFSINAISFYSMPVHLLCNAVFALLLLQPTPRRTLAAGLVGGLALTLHNPSRHMVFALPWLLWLAWNWRGCWRAMFALAAGYLPWMIVVGLGWNHLRSVLSVTSAAAASAASHGLSDMLMWLAQVDLPGPSQMDDWAISLAKAWLWATPFLLLLASLGYERRREDVRIRLLYASLVVTILARLLVPFNQGHGWGFRFLHGSWFVLPVLAALAVMPSGGSSETRKVDGPVAWTRAGALAGLAVLLPYFAWQVHAFITVHLQQMPQVVAGEPRVILIEPAGYYPGDLVQNDPFLREGVIRMVSNGEQYDREMLAKHFPGLVLLSRDERGSVWGYSR